ncbi:uncharacterized protein [Rutidosis leptorrhynchoides]|uniref:uncharacterized protein n=1 Tax=Rutidosis leptorrhynchoides TaxID=125765 RepID=UPI003A993996
MDWFSWLSKTHLEPSFIHEYAQAFSHNQLEEDDISYFNHEFLQSMGIFIAKHRLEIIKLAKKSSGLHPMTKLITAIKKTKKTVGRYVKTWVHRNDASMITVQRKSYSARWKGAMVKRSNRLVMNSNSNKQLMITNGYNRPIVRSNGAKVNSFSSPLVYDNHHFVEKKEDVSEYGEDLYGNNDEDYGDGYWSKDSSKGVEDIKWDAMFQNLKPT